MEILIQPGSMSGTLPAIPSKSDAHRLMICAALGDRPTQLQCSATSKDLEATAQCLRALGGSVEWDGAIMTITPITQPLECPQLHCGESGSTFRFLLPVAAALCDRVAFTGEGRLPQRPIGALKKAMEEQGIQFSQPNLPFETRGRLAAGTYTLPGNISSQYITGLLLALPLCSGDSTILLSTKLESAAYVEITLHALAKFGIQIENLDQGWRIPGGQTFRSPGMLAVEGDWSNASFFLAAGALGQPVTLTGLNTQSPQGDKAVLEVLNQFGASILVEEHAITVSPGVLKGITVDVSEIPDALPILAVVAACAQGETRFVNAARLRLKESDRLTSTAALLHALGGQVWEEPEGLRVRGGSLAGGTVDGWNDHRIVMAAAIAALRCDAPVTILGAEAMNKSYPGFLEHYTALGGTAHVL